MLAQVQKSSPPKGRIISGDGKSHRLTLDDRILVPILEQLQEWRIDTTPESPVVLNRHCILCPFTENCRAKAEQEDNLSLLNGITPKAISGPTRLYLA